MAHVQEVLAGRYELLDVLGRGGMGVVYRARDRVLDRAVAIKVLPVDRAEDPTFVARFEREALAAAALSHPNIVAVFDSGQDGETRFIVMEYVAGESLAQLIRRRGRVPAEEAVLIATQIASALAAAHHAGIVHRDIKPGNAMLDSHGTVKVLDFGIARAAGGTSLTQTAIVLGSAAYLAPEVSRGQAADARSDIYALGCVLYELLTGRPPFTGELPAAILHQHNTAVPRAPKDLDAGVPAGVDALVMRLLAKDPNQRPQRARELVRALPASLEHDNSAAAPTRALAGVLIEPTRILLRRPKLARAEQAGLGLATVLVLVGLGIWLLGSSGAADKPAAASRTISQSAARDSSRRPRTVAAAGRALTNLATEDLKAGTIDKAAAEAIRRHVQDVVAAHDDGRGSDALRDLAALSSQVTQLSGRGAVKSAALPKINAAIANLRSALEQAARATTTTAAPAVTTSTTRRPSAPQPAAPKAGPPPPAGPKPEPKPHGRDRSRSD